MRSVARCGVPPSLLGSLSSPLQPVTPHPNALLSGCHLKEAGEVLPPLPLSLFCGLPSIPDSPPTGLYPPETAFQPLFRPPVAACATTLWTPPPPLVGGLDRTGGSVEPASVAWDCGMVKNVSRVQKNRIVV